MNAKICSKCIMNNNTPGIHFNDKGVCNYCENYKKMETLGEDRLLAEFDKYRDKDPKYDCMIGLSGGRDSTYTMWKLVNDYKMRVLAIHYDNPFTSPYAKMNMINASKILNVDVIKWGFKQGEHLNATKKALKIWANNPSSKMIPVVCAHCKNWWPTIFKYAQQNGIRLIVIGSNPLETASFKKDGFGGARTYHKLSNVPNVLWKAFQELINNPSYMSLSWPLILSMYAGASHSSPYLKWRYKEMKVIRLFDYIRWDEQEVENSITKYLNWRKSPEVASSWRFDCRLDYVRRKMYESTVGATELQDLLSKMIREEMITRETAIRRLESEGHIAQKVIDDVLLGLGLKLDDLNLKGALGRQAVTHR